MLVDKIEKSKTYTGKNKRQQKFYILPTNLYEQYYDTDSDEKQICLLNVSISELVKDKLVAAQYYDTGELYRIYAIPWQYASYCKILGIKEKRVEANESIALFQEYYPKSDILNKICMDQYKRLLANKKINIASNPSQLKDILMLIDQIETNQSELLYRELSISLFGDSKIFERKYKDKIGKLFLKHSDYKFVDDSLSKAMQIDLIFENYLIVKNPTYINFKGKGAITFTDGFQLPIDPHHSTSLMSSDIKNIDKITINANRVMTVENLTSFNRLYDENTLFIYLSGYNSLAKTNFLRLLKNNREDISWYHFGDIDPDGFLIFENLKKTTGINFCSYYMNIATLQQYSSYTKKLEKNDIKKANNMILNNVNAEIARYMLDNNCKLEQEIISLQI